MSTSKNIYQDHIYSIYLDVKKTKIVILSFINSSIIYVEKY